MIDGLPARNDPVGPTRRTWHLYHGRCDPSDALVLRLGHIA